MAERFLTREELIRIAQNQAEKLDPDQRTGFINRLSLHLKNNPNLATPGNITQAIRDTLIDPKKIPQIQPQQREARSRVNLVQGLEVIIENPEWAYRRIQQEKTKLASGREAYIVLATDQNLAAPLSEVVNEIRVKEDSRSNLYAWSLFTRIALGEAASTDPALADVGYIDLHTMNDFSALLSTLGLQVDQPRVIDVFGKRALTARTESFALEIQLGYPDSDKKRRAFAGKIPSRYNNQGEVSGANALVIYGSPSLDSTDGSRAAGYFITDFPNSQRDVLARLKNYTQGLTSVVTALSSTDKFRPQPTQQLNTINLRAV